MERVLYQFEMFFTVLMERKRTRRLIDKLTRNSPDMLVQSSQAVDTKMVGVIAAAIVVIGVVAAAIGDNEGTAYRGRCFIAFAVIMYITVLAAGAWCHWSRGFRRPTSPPLLEKRRDLPRKVFLEWHREYVRQAYTKNKKVLDQKSLLLKTGLVCLAAETLPILAWMISVVAA